MALVASLVILTGVSGFAQEKSIPCEINQSFLGKDPVSGDLIQYDVRSEQTENGGRQFFLLTNGGAANNSSEDLESIAKAYLNEIKGELAISFSENEFQVNHSANESAQHVFFDQFIYGIPVFGGQISVHFDTKGQMKAANGVNYITKPSVRTSRYTSTQVIETAKTDVHNYSIPRHLNSVQKKLLQYDGPSASLIYYPLGDKLELAWKISYCPNFQETWQVFVSAENGEVLYRKELSCQIDGHKTSHTSTNLKGQKVSVNTYQKNNTFYLIDASKPMFDAEMSVFPENPVGVIKSYNAEGLSQDRLDKAFLLSSSSNEFGQNTAEKAVVSAQENASIYYDKLNKAPFHFNSYDNKGSNITMYVNIADPLNPFKGWENASWNGRVAFFGAGHETYHSPLSRSLDVVSHEITHGLIQHATHIQDGSSPHSQALIEAICDIMAMLVDEDFTIGEDADLNSATRPSGMIRNPSNPHNNLSSKNNWKQNQAMGYTANHMDEYVNDESAAHYNSSILSHAFYLLADNSKGSGLGRYVASELFFDVITNYLNSNADFYDFKDAFLLAADIRFGAGSKTIDLVKRAFDQVGLYSPIKDISTKDLPALVGENFIMCHSSLENGFDNDLSLINLSTSEEDLRLGMEAQIKNNASVTDNGEIIYGINVNNEVLRIDYGENLLYQSMSNEIGLGYDQVAITKDNSQLVLVKKKADTAIHIYNFYDGTFHSYSIDAPSYVIHDNEFYELQPFKVGVMEWNHNSNKILYEYQSKFTDKMGNEHIVWNIAEIKVKDDGSQEFLPKGDIYIFYHQLSSHIDVRFPSFAKNTPSLFVHDVYDKSKNQNTIIAWDRNADFSEHVEVMKTRIPAHASYTNTDSGLVINDLDLNNEPALYLVQLQSDKVTLKSGLSPLKIVSERENPKWFTLGNRVGKETIDHSKNVTISVFPNPAKDQLFVEGLDANFDYTIYNNIGQTVLKGKSSQDQGIDVEFIQKGAYHILISAENGNQESLLFIKQ